LWGAPYRILDKNTIDFFADSAFAQMRGLTPTLSDGFSGNFNRDQVNGVTDNSKPFITQGFVFAT